MKTELNSIAGAEGRPVVAEGCSPVGTSSSTTDSTHDDAACVRSDRHPDLAGTVTLYGPELSYFTGKLEGVLRYMRLPYNRLTRGPVGEVAAKTGTAQVPALGLKDGRILTDTTPILEWLDARNPQAPIVPEDPVCAFFSWMLEDYADEWLWRPAMHFRWDYAESAKHQSRVLADADDSVPIPSFVKRYVICNRQRKFFTLGDGVSTETWDHVEKSFYDTLDQFAAILKSRPFLLGDRPSLADFGFFGPMFRHFSMDPTSARIMREKAPSVFEWVARTWNARHDTISGDLLDEVPNDWDPILWSIGSTYLPHLQANAEAWQVGKTHFDVTIEGTLYRNIRTSVYRVWCLDELRRRFEELSEADQKKAKERLENCNCWEPLWRTELPASARSLNPDAPFGCVGAPTGMTRKAAESLYWLPVFAPKPPKERKKEDVMATTALVTGASSGIGQEIARLHARKGGNLVLVARNESALNELKQELVKAHGISVKVIVKDLAQPNAATAIFDATEAAGIQVDMLINNAGIGGYGMLQERELDSDRAMIQVNMTALVDLTHLYLPGMRARGYGKILQVASIAGMMPGPSQAVYFASKSFVLSFSQAISEELSGTGVTCTALCPGAVETGFAAASNLEDAAIYSKPGASAFAVAECGYKAMLDGDLVKINDSVTGFVLNWIMPLLPRRLVLKIARKTMEKV